MFSIIFFIADPVTAGIVIIRVSVDTGAKGMEQVFGYSTALRRVRSESIVLIG